MTPERAIALKKLVSYPEWQDFKKEIQSEIDGIVLLFLSCKEEELKPNQMKMQELVRVKSLIEQKVKEYDDVIKESL